MAINGKVKKGIELVEQLQNLSVFDGILNEKREAHDSLYQKTLEHIHSQMSKKPRDLGVEQVLKQYLKQVESQGQLIDILQDFKVDIIGYLNNVNSYNKKVIKLLENLLKKFKENKKVQSDQIHELSIEIDERIKL